MSEAIAVSTVDLSGLAWRRSSRTGGGSNTNCVEVAFAGSAVVVRDSKSPSGGVLIVPAAGWRSLLQLPGGH
jgi:Domain of unknown function (DUF397)